MNCIQLDTQNLTSFGRVEKNRKRNGNTQKKHCR